VGGVSFAHVVVADLWARLAAVLVLAGTVVVFPQRPAAATDTQAGGQAADLCSVEEWRIDPGRCLDELGDVVHNRVACLKAPTPDTPDAGLGGWFAQRPEADRQSGVAGLYTSSGYAGYSYTTYDIGCAATVMHPDYKFETTIANAEFMIATGVIGAANALRERAWDPGIMWSWADPLVAQATRTVYERVFTVFGTVTLAIVGIYLLWRSRQARMSVAMTTAGWAVLVMLIVTALASWPVQSARAADQTLIATLDAIHGAVGPPTTTTPTEECPFPDDPEACVDHRPPALRASDNAVHMLLYRNWLRGLLGSADSPTAQKYGYALYAARTFSWGELASARDPATRAVMLERKQRDWMRIAEQIKAEDPEAYQYLQGVRGMDRIGAGLIAILSALTFAVFDLTASLLVLLGFLILRWAVIAAPVIGTVGILRPASGGFRRLVHSVVAALFNIVVFGTGGALYLHAADLVLKTPTLPGWLQMVLVLLCGVVGWLLLRPYRRVTQLGGKDPLAAIAAGGLVNGRQLRRERAAAAATSDDPGRVPPADDQPPLRIELRSEPPPEVSRAEPRTDDAPRRTGIGWQEPPPAQAGVALYRPGRTPTTTVDEPAAATRIEARSER